ncbi:MAG: SDR family NAD(P)-dependent oxidoreductase [Porticoccaceae bacterium]|nr:SDR family NAD(P)-dependent oxidoreductase [Porticoccaceae bacterium]
MDLNNQVVIVTGGANGIGRAMCEKFAAAGAKVAVADMDVESAAKVAASINGIAISTNVGIEEDIQSLVKETEDQLGPVDIFVSNAGVSFSDAPGWMAASAPNEHWMTSWNVNVMAHVFAARAVVPSMIKRGGGYLINIASGASLLCQIGDAAYSTTKTAAVGFAESLAITHGDDNIKVSVVCPLYVATAMTEGGRGISGQDEVMTAEEAADAIFSGMEKETFMIFPHPELKSYAERKGEDYDRWVKSMRRIRQGMLEQHPNYAYKV